MDAFGISLLIGLLSASVGVLLLVASRAARYGGQGDRWRSHDVLVRGVAVLCLLLGFGVPLAAIVVSLGFWVNNAAPAPTELIVLAVVISVLTLPFGIAGALLLFVGGRRYENGSLQDERFRDGVLANVSIIAWGTIIVYSGGFLILGAPAILFAIGSLANWRKSRQAQLLWMLAIAAEGESPLAEEFEAFADQHRGQARWQAWTVAEMLRHGETLSDALARMRHLLPQSAVLTIAAGERAGTLPQALREAAVDFTRRNQADSNAQSPLLFLYLLANTVTISILLVNFLMIYIVPKFKKIYQDFGMELPDVTRALISASDLFAKYFYVAFPLMGLIAAPLLYLVFRMVQTSPLSGDEAGSPLLSRLWPSLHAPPLLRSLAIIVRAGQPLLWGGRLLAAIHPSLPIRQRLDKVVLEIESGGECWNALRMSGLINPQEASLLASAERLGNLPWSLQTVANLQQARRRSREELLLELVQPFLILVVAGSVAFIVFGMFAPLIHMISALS